MKRLPLVLILLMTWVAGASSVRAQIGFARATTSPVVPAANRNSTWHSQHAANPSVIRFGDNVFMYFRGISGSAPSTVGVWTASGNNFNGTSWNETPAGDGPILQPSGGTFDSTGIYDPSAIVFNGKVYVYYMGTGNGTSQVGLATSSDGLHFEKQGIVWGDGGTPVAVATSSGVTLLYTHQTAGGGWEYWVTSSADGVNFGPAQRALSPTGISGALDKVSTITGSIFSQPPYYYFLYGGSPTCSDYPEGSGLARSTDLVNWERYSGSPVLFKGPSGGWDEAAIWSPSFLNVNGVNYLWYEGAGSAQGGGSGASENARQNCYGGYGSTEWSQIGLAIAPSATFNLADWDPQNSINTNYNYVLKALHDGQCLEAAGAGTTDGTNAQQSVCTGDAKQSWSLQRVSGGYYQISSVHAGADGNQTLEVSGQAVTNQANVDTYRWFGNNNQQWSFEPVAANTYNVVNRNSGQSLEVIGGQTSAGSNVDQYPWGLYDNQKWLLTRNWVSNPGFEAGSKVNWNTWSGNGTESASYVETGGYSGSYRLTHGSGSPYQVYTSQTITGLANGAYTLAARVTGGGGQTVAYLSAKDFQNAGAEMTADLVGRQTGWPDMQLVRIPGIQVQNNQITIGLYTSDSTGGHWLSIDDVTLIEQ